MMPAAKCISYGTNDISTFLSQKGYDAIPILQNTAGLLLITVKVNGIEGPFILDTGAGVSVIDSSKASRFQLTLKKDSATSPAAGAGGQVEVIPSEGNKIEIGNHIVTDFTPRSCRLSMSVRR